MNTFNRWCNAIVLFNFIILGVVFYTHEVEIAVYGNPVINWLGIIILYSYAKGRKNDSNFDLSRAAVTLQAMGTFVAAFLSAEAFIAYAFPAAGHTPDLNHAFGPFIEGLIAAGLTPVLVSQLHSLSGKKVAKSQKSEAEQAAALGLTPETIKALNNASAVASIGLDPQVVNECNAVMAEVTQTMKQFNETARETSQHMNNSSSGFVKLVDNLGKLIQSTKNFFGKGSIDPDPNATGGLQS